MPSLFGDASYAIPAHMFRRIPAWCCGSSRASAQVGGADHASTVMTVTAVSTLSVRRRSMLIQAHRAPQLKPS